jgi:hypothetical protein
MVEEDKEAEARSAPPFLNEEKCASSPQVPTMAANLQFLVQR